MDSYPIGMGIQCAVQSNSIHRQQLVYTTITKYSFTSQTNNEQNQDIVLRNQKVTRQKYKNGFR